MRDKEVSLEHNVDIWIAEKREIPNIRYMRIEKRIMDGKNMGLTPFFHFDNNTFYVDNNTLLEEEVLSMYMCMISKIRNRNRRLPRLFAIVNFFACLIVFVEMWSKLCLLLHLLRLLQLVGFVEITRQKRRWTSSEDAWLEVLPAWALIFSSLLIISFSSTSSSTLSLLSPFSSAFSLASFYLLFFPFSSSSFSATTLAVLILLNLTSLIAADLRTYSTNGVGYCIFGLLPASSSPSRLYDKFGWRFQLLEKYWNKRLITFGHFQCLSLWVWGILEIHGEGFYLHGRVMIWVDYIISSVRINSRKGKNCKDRGLDIEVKEILHKFMNDGIDTWEVERKLTYSIREVGIMYKITELEDRYSNRREVRIDKKNSKERGLDIVESGIQYKFMNDEGGIWEVERKLSYSIRVEGMINKIMKLEDGYSKGREFRTDTLVSREFDLTREKTLKGTGNRIGTKAVLLKCNKRGEKEIINIREVGKIAKEGNSVKAINVYVRGRVNICWESIKMDQYEQRLYKRKGVRDRGSKMEHMFIRKASQECEVVLKCTMYDWGSIEGQENRYQTLGIRYFMSFLFEIKSLVDQGNMVIYLLIEIRVQRAKVWKELSICVIEMYNSKKDIRNKFVYAILCYSNSKRKQTHRVWKGVRNFCMYITVDKGKEVKEEYNKQSERHTLRSNKNSQKFIDNRLRGITKVGIYEFRLMVRTIRQKVIGSVEKGIRIISILLTTVVNMCIGNVNISGRTEFSSKIKYTNYGSIYKMWCLANNKSQWIGRKLNKCNLKGKLGNRDLAPTIMVVVKYDKGKRGLEGTHINKTEGIRYVRGEGYVRMIVIIDTDLDLERNPIRGSNIRDKIDWQKRFIGIGVNCKLTVRYAIWNKGSRCSRHTKMEFRGNGGNIKREIMINPRSRIIKRNIPPVRRGLSKNLGTEKGSIHTSKKDGRKMERQSRRNVYRGTEDRRQKNKTMRAIGSQGGKIVYRMENQYTDGSRDGSGICTHLLLDGNGFKVKAALLLSNNQMETRLRNMPFEYNSENGNLELYEYKMMYCRSVKTIIGMIHKWKYGIGRMRIKRSRRLWVGRNIVEDKGKYNMKYCEWIIIMFYSLRLYRRNRGGMKLIPHESLTKYSMTSEKFNQLHNLKLYRELSQKGGIINGIWNLKTWTDKGRNGINPGNSKHGGHSMRVNNYTKKFNIDWGVRRLAKGHGSQTWKNRDGCNLNPLQMEGISKPGHNKYGERNG